MNTLSKFIAMMLGMVVTVCSATGATVTFNTRDITGTALNAPISVAPIETTLNGSYIIAGPAIRLMPTNGVAVTNLTAGKHTCQFTGYNFKPFTIGVPDDTNGYSATTLISTGAVTLVYAEALSAYIASNCIVLYASNAVKQWSSNINTVAYATNSGLATNADSAIYSGTATNKITSTNDIGAWAMSEAWQPVGAIMRDTWGVATNVPVVRWPDGASGDFLALSNNLTWHAVDSYRMTYTNGATVYTLTLPTVLRDSTGAITNLSQITIE